MLTWSLGAELAVGPAGWWRRLLRASQSRHAPRREDAVVPENPFAGKANAT
jgi:hypothetical protein